MANVESWDGTNWTETTDVNAQRVQAAGAGTQTATLFFGGEGSPFADNKNKTELWNGTTWTEVNNLNEGRSQPGGGGISTSAISVNGYNGSAKSNDAETWDGTSWTEISNTNVTAEGRNGAAHSNTQAIVFGGRAPAYLATTEQWDGSTWTEVADLATARYNGTSSGSGTSAWLAGGYPGSNPQPAITEEWTQANISKRLGVS